ncbi:MAG: calcium/sodium antiporter [Patescibacteria group bacterium]|nr:calcium/sodium antiporter [Patescibacteria group bacterium]
MIIVWSLVFIISLILLVKSADWLIESSEKIGFAFKISPFVIGVTIVAFGTSFPELASSIAAVMKGVTEIVVANVVGSNIANIFLIVGLSAVVARHIVVKKNLIDLDAPLLITATLIFLFTAWDRKIVLWEGIILIIAFVFYILYTFLQKREKRTDEAFDEKQEAIKKDEKEFSSQKLNFKVFFFLILGIIGLGVGANYTIESILEISYILGISASLIAITAVAIGTSLPELVVSVRACSKKKYEVALGNVFGSNVFNLLLVVGVPALIKPLKIDNSTFEIGLPFLIIATLLFIVSGISRRIHIWEGLMYLLIYALFLVKLFGLF